MLLIQWRNNSLINVVGGLAVMTSDDQLDVESSDGWLDSLSEAESLTGTGIDAELSESHIEPSFTITLSGSAIEQHPVRVTYAYQLFFFCWCNPFANIVNRHVHRIYLPIFGMHT